VELATGVSGKSLGAYAGIAIAFAAPGALAGLCTERMPPSLDLKAAMESDCPRFTFPSPALRALAAALRAYASPGQAAGVYERYRSLGRRVREELRKLRIAPLAEEPWASPVITTFHPPGQSTSDEFVGRCRALGFDVGGLSSYLRERRLVQIATMGDIGEEDLLRFFEKLSLEWLDGSCEEEEEFATEARRSRRAFG
jgi:aspartate aminotransferase-like enzyme